MSRFPGKISPFSVFSPAKAIRSWVPLAAAAAASIAVTELPAQAITTWNWGFQTADAQQFGSGTFTTADVTPQTGVTYQITGITGTYNRSGTAYSITGLYTGGWGFKNKFRWDGTPGSNVLTDIDGIGFTLSGTSNTAGFYNGSGGFAAANRTVTDFSGSDANVTSSLLAPNVPASVPGPLPVMGAGAAFAWSRRLRRRVASRPALKH